MVIATDRKPALARAVLVSGNSKTGPVSITYASQNSCPVSCPLLNNGCYAENGHIRFIRNRLNKAEVSATPEDVARDEAAAIDSLPAILPLRLHGVGDCPTVEAASIVAGAAKRFRQRGGGPVWTYTHAWRDVPREVWGDDVNVLASCESTGEAHEAEEQGYVPAIIVPEHPQDGKAYMRDGLKMIPCPEQTGRTTNCTTCRLCWDEDKLRKQGAAITFQAHGARKSLVRSMVERKDGE